MNRNDIEEKYQWDLSLIYNSEEAFYKDYTLAKDNISKFENYKDTFLNSIDNFKEFMTLFENVARKLDKLYQYTHLSVDVEPENDNMQNKNAEVMALFNEFNQNTVFMDLKIRKNENKVKEFLKDESLKEYHKYINDILRAIPHLASDEVEYVIAIAEPALEASYETYSVLRPEFEPVIIDGKEHFLNEETASEFLKNPNEEIRKQTYEKLYKEYKKFSNIYASTLAGNIKKDVFYSKVHNFETPLEAAQFGDNAPKELFYKVIDMALNKYHNYLLDYVEIRKKCLNKNKLEIYDMNIPLASIPNTKYSLDDAFDLIFEATKYFGEDYKNILEKAKNERWIDYYTHSGKRHGAYSSGCYDSNPYILMSFLGELESVFTLIHELGHSVHSYYSQNNQPYFLHDYKIFVAEVASTVNENLLMLTLMQKSSNKEEKAYLLYKQIYDYIALIYRQPFFANYEDILHNKVANNESISNQTMTDLYEKLTKEYWGENVNIHEYTKYSCYAVPHFYYNYYVYKYTIGQCVSSVIANRIFNGDKEQTDKYLNFLKSGCTKDPIELLKDAGVDPLDDKIYDEAVSYFKKLLDEFKEII